MATADAHTRFVTFAKIVLPLLALAILSTLFLVSGEVNPNDAIPFANIDVKEAAREQRLTNPRYTTVGTDGAIIEFKAAEARPDLQNPGRFTATKISGEVTTTDGRTMTFKAGMAELNTSTEKAVLSQNVHVYSTDDYDLTAPEMAIRMDRAEISSEGPIKAATPFGTLEAGSMLLSRGKGEGTPYRLLFTNKVRLVYAPQK